MKNITKGLVVGVALAFPLLAQAATPGVGLYNTHHDFASRAQFMATQTTSDGVTALATPNSVGLCSYCHTPHSAYQTSLLWNHTLSANTFGWDDATTTAGTNYASIAPTYKGPSVKCLSCHDGSVAIGDVNLYREDKGTFNTFKVGATTGGADVVGASGNMSGTHPIAMPYPMGSASTYNNISTGSRIVLTEFQAAPEGTNGTKIKLYTDTTGTGTNIIGGGTAGKAGIECSSCHDVHNKASVEDLFLRGKIAGSQATDGYICLQCHIK